MKNASLPFVALFAATCLLFFYEDSAPAQYAMPAVMDSASIPSQIDYIQDRTRIYNDFRAIREDIFQRLKSNIIDSLLIARTEITQLNQELQENNEKISLLNNDLEKAKSDRDQAIRTKESLTFIGLQMNKALYNSIMWIIVLGLALLVFILFLLFKRTHAVTIQTRKELEQTKDEFETYRKSAREKYEKLVVNHHNEIMKLKRS